ncbi:hypothetical protein H6B07_02190 [Mediterraneibacter glycyrrhizinilyticus]|nr:hypothetical protein [Mediterraneibacter glycyrrhizinilyticus]
MKKDCGGSDVLLVLPGPVRALGHQRLVEQRFMLRKREGLQNPVNLDGFHIML